METMGPASASERRLRSSACAVLLLLTAGAARAQQAPAGFVTPEEDPIDTSWRLRRAVSLNVGGQYGFGGGLGLAYGRGPINGPVARGARLGFMAHYGITGSRDAALTFDAPGIDANWRFYATLRSERMLRTPYFGVANGERAEDSLTAAYTNKYYRYALLRSTAYGVVQRRLTGPLWLHAGGQARRYRSASLEQTPSLYQRETIAAARPDTQVFKGSEMRGGLIWDTRNDWVTPTRGIMLEGIIAKGHVSDAGVSTSYTRYLWGAREFIPLERDGRTVLALRQRVGLSSDTLPFYLAFEQLTSWEPDDGVMGRRAIRLHGRGDQLSSNSAFLSVDVRRVLIPPDWRERPRRLWILALLDIGILWEPRESASLHRHEWTAGTGFRLQIGRGFLAGVDFGMTNTGPHASAGSRFAF